MGVFTFSNPTTAFQRISVSIQYRGFQHGCDINDIRRTQAQSLLIVLAE